MLKVLHGTINVNIEPLFLRVGGILATEYQPSTHYNIVPFFVCFYIQLHLELLASFLLLGSLAELVFNEK